MPGQSRMLGAATAFVRARAGNMALVVAGLAPVLLGVGAVAVDFSSAFATRSAMQSAADAAALAAARELPLRSTSATTVNAIVSEYLHSNLQNITLETVSSSIIGNRAGVQVDVTAHVPSMMGRLFNPAGLTPHVKAVARLSNAAPLCALALEERAADAIQLQQSARVTAPNCAVYSNSTSPRGVVADTSSELTATMICSAGGYAGSRTNYSPEPLTDCPLIDDPLADRPEPRAGGCDHLLMLQVAGQVRLRPGVYCGGITVLAGATVRLDPGVYVIKNGPLMVLNNATLIGEGAGFYFVGDLSNLTFAAGSHVDLSAPRDGPMAGFLFFANRVLLTGNLNLRHFSINSDDARNLLGTIYLRDGVLDVDAHQPIADRSDYTVIVARRITVKSGPNLVLNADYEGSAVPVPEGVGPRPQEAFLAQ